MRAYNNIKFAEGGGDVGDIRTEGRKSCVGRIRRGEAYNYYGRRFNDAAKICHNDRGYNRNTIAKAATRRFLKRVDRAIGARFDVMAEGE